MKEIDYDKALEVITSIGYKQRTGTYYVIREDDGYINISHDKCFHEDAPISFHKNFSGGNHSPDGKYILHEDFYTLEDFYDFISDYHNDLFLKHKVEKLLHNIT